MEKFIHTSIRLNTDLGRATRYTTDPEQLSKWLCEGAAHAGGPSDIVLSGVKTPDDCWKWHLKEICREKTVIVTCSDLLGSAENRSYTLEIQLMKCTSQTEYCSEIHLIQRGFEDSEEEDSFRTAYTQLWQHKLEALRALVNGKWIIEDRDLTLDIFK